MDGKLFSSLKLLSFALLSSAFLFACGSVVTSSKAPVVDTTGTVTGGSTSVTPTTGGTGSPSSPTSLVATGLTSSSIKLTWICQSCSGGFIDTGYNVYRSSTGVAGSYVLLTSKTPSVVHNTLNYTDSGLSSLATYYYEVTAMNSVGESAVSNSATGTTLSAAAPSNLVATPIASGGINLTWVDNSGGTVAVNVQRSFTLNGTYSTIGSLSAGITNFTDASTLYPSTPYFYRVETATSPIVNSNIATATTFSGIWNNLGALSTGTSSHPSSATDSTGNSLIVWQQHVNGVDQIYATYAGAPFAVNTTFGTETYDSTSGLYTAVTFKTVDYSNAGKGISQAAGNAQNPVVICDGYDAFIVAWQEKRGGYFRIVTRRIANIAYHSVSSTVLASFSDSTVTTNDAHGASNPSEANSYTLNAVVTANAPSGVVASEDSINPAIAAAADHSIYVVWQQFVSASYPTGTYQIYGTRTTPAAPGVYSAGSGAIVNTAWAGWTVSAAATSNLLNGISQSATAANQATNPSVAVKSGTPDIYVTWQQYNSTAGTPNWDIMVAHNTSAPVNITNNSGDSQHPKVIVDTAGLPYVAWDDNTTYGGASSSFPTVSGQLQIYLLKGNLAGSSWASTAVEASSPTVGTSTNPGDVIMDNSHGIGGISRASGSTPQLPSLSTNGRDIIVAWQDRIAGHWNVFADLFSTSVPNEGPDWIGLSNSNIITGVSNSSADAEIPSISFTTTGQIQFYWQDDSSGSFAIYGATW